MQVHCEFVGEVSGHSDSPSNEGEGCDVGSGSYLVSGNGVPGEVHKKVIVRGQHRTGVLLQHRAEGFPDGCAVLVPGRNDKFIKGRAHCNVMSFHFSQCTPRALQAILSHTNSADLSVQNR